MALRVAWTIFHDEVTVTVVGILKEFQILHAGARRDLTSLLCEKKDLTSRVTCHSPYCQRKTRPAHLWGLVLPLSSASLTPNIPHRSKVTSNDPEVLRLTEAMTEYFILFETCSQIGVSMHSNFTEQIRTLQRGRGGMEKPLGVLSTTPER